MWLIDRYILKLFSGYLVGGIVVFVTLFLVGDILPFALRYSDASTTSLIRFYGYRLPEIINQLMPVVCLMAMLFTFSNLNKSNELVALFSSGVSLGRLAAPPLLLVLLIAGGMIFMSDQVLPRFAQKKNYVEYVEIRKKPGLYSTVKTNRIWYRSDNNMLFNIKTLDPQAARAQGLTMYYFDNDWNLVQLVTAKEVVMEGHAWDLKNGFVTLFAAESSFPLTKAFESKTISMNEDLTDLQTSNTSDVMSLRELSRFIDRNKEAGLNTTQYEVDFHRRFGFAFAAVVMALIGVPFSVSRSRSGGSMANLGICMGLAVAYWGLYNSFVILGQHGSLPPVLAAWTANLLMGGVSYVLLRRLPY